jgi:hypothetical protein
MASDSKIKPKWLAALLAFLGWAILFGLIYAQSPLYTSNQNTYFLHGMAQAGFGQLSRDWTARTGAHAGTDAGFQRVGIPHV